MGLVLGLLIATMGSAAAHDQKITDGANDALDFSTGNDPAAAASTPLDFRQVLFNEKSTHLIFRLSMREAVTPDELCDGDCTLANFDNEGVIIIDIFKGSISDPKSYYFVVIAANGGQYAAGLYNASGNPISGGLVAQLINDGEGFLMKVVRKKVRGYPKGAKMKWIVSSAYGTDESGSSCVPNGTAPYYGLCWDFVPDNGTATHTLRN